MRLNKILLGLLVAGCMEGAMAAPAGKVLALVGAASVERAGRQISLANGGEVENGDLIRVGEQSSLQVRFTDDSIVALRANSVFKIEDFQFAKNADSDRSIFGLIKGGMRTITGLIGKANRNNYEVRTATSTIGIRGTHYVVVACSNDCFDSRGAKIPDGTFGGVTDGRIAVTNESGEQEFGQQEYFHVPDRKSPPVRLLAPPSVMKEQAVQRLVNLGGAVSPSDSRQSPALPGSGAPQTTNSPQLAVLAGPDTVLPASVATFSVTNQPAIVGSSAGAGANIAFSQSNGYAYPSSLITTNIGATEYSGAELSVLLGAPGITDAASLASAATAFGIPVTYVAAADAYYMYEAPYAVDEPGHFGWHTAFGNAPASWPTSGVAQYNYAGGTAPTDNFGRVGSFSPGNLSMNFSTQQVTNLSNMVMSFGAGGGQTATTYTMAANQTWSMQNMANLSVTCTGCVSTANATVNGTFSGANAQGYLGTFAVYANQLTTYRSHAAGAVAVFVKQ